MDKSFTWHAVTFLFGAMMVGSAIGVCAALVWAGANYPWQCAWVLFVGVVVRLTYIAGLHFRLQRGDLP